VVVGPPVGIAAKASPQLVYVDGMPQCRVAPIIEHIVPDLPAEIQGDGVPPAPRPPDIYGHATPAAPGMRDIGVALCPWVSALNVAHYLANIWPPGPACRP